MIHFLFTGLIILSLLPLIAAFLLGYQLIRNGQGILGKPTIQPFIFYLSKAITGLIFALTALVTWCPYFFHLWPWLLQITIPAVQKLLALIFLFAGNILLLPALCRMSIFTRIGLPTGPHPLITTGAYSVSRNPMYTSFFCFYTSCFLLIPSLLILGLIFFDLIVHHQIIFKEEQFLRIKFSKNFEEYCGRVSRYL